MASWHADLIAACFDTQQHGQHAQIHVLSG
jgi:hypothetical protein